MSELLRVSWALGRRATRNALRRPQFLLPLVMFPSLFLAVNVGGLHRTTGLQGFPKVNGFLDFQLAAAMTQSLLLGGITQGIASALDLELGFFDRLAVSPISRVSIVIGRLIAAAAIAMFQVGYFLALGLIFGASIEGGFLGVLVTFGLGLVAAIAFAAIGVAIALRAGNASTLQGIFPLVFVILFLSSAFFPRALLASPIDTFARYNPLSYIADGMRAPIIDSATSTAVLDGLFAGAGLAAFAVGMALLALRGRLRNA
ncbi:MAG: ABC transporter permease [Solirubrobacteraceae bacterium]